MGDNKALKTDETTETLATEFYIDEMLSEKEREELMAKLDKEASFRKLSGPLKIFTTAILLLFTLFQMYTALVPTLPTQILRMTHLGFVVVLAYLLYPRTAKGDRSKIALSDFVLGAIFFSLIAYYIFNFNAIISRSGMYNQTDIIVGVVGTLLLLEACRRVVGLPIVVIALTFIVYAYFGKNMPGLLSHRGYGIERIATHLFYTTEGIIGLPLGTAATYIFLFILFGAFLEKTGIGEFFIEIANAIAGWAPGGPAKVAVLTSALEGTISGSSVSNTVSSGAFTIPLMKSLGYKPEFAAAVEAAASTGGQIMPPIMGAAAFLIAESVGVPYIEVAKAAILPAILYFTGIWIMVHFEAKKLGLVGIPRNQLPSPWKIVKEKGHLMLPLVVIMVLLSMDRTPVYAALWGIVASVIAPYLRKSTWVSPKVLSEALITSTITAPIVMQLGVPALAAHLFAFYFGILADITPPVALAAFAGSAIAKSDPLKTGIQATKLAIAAFIIPYIFVLNPALIWIDATLLQMIGIFITSIIGMVGISVAMTGWMSTRVSPAQRMLFLVSGLLLIYPGMLTDIAGIGMITALTFNQMAKTKKIKAVGTIKI